MLMGEMSERQGGPPPGFKPVSDQKRRKETKTVQKHNIPDIPRVLTPPGIAPGMSPFSSKREKREEVHGRNSIDQQ